MDTESQSTEGIAEMITHCESWLKDQPGMQPFELAVIVLTDCLEEWFSTYSHKVCDRDPDKIQSIHSPCLERLWKCWSHHWKLGIESQASGVVDGSEVAADIQAERRWNDKSDLGGDPLRDVVLAVAMVAMHNRAVQCFTSEYYEYSRQLALRNVGMRYRNTSESAEDWWNEFLKHLSGLDKKSASLDRFNGESSLFQWLPTVVRNFLASLQRSEKNLASRLTAGAEGDQLAAFSNTSVHKDYKGESESTSESDEGIHEESFLLLFQVLRKVCDALPSRERLVLQYLYVDGLPLKQVAAVLGVHSGNAGRTRDRAVGRIQEESIRVATEMGQKAAFADCIEYISTEGPHGFGDAIRIALEETRSKEQRS